MITATLPSSLSTDEQNLFKERILFLDRKLSPGLSSLTWASKGITDMFIKDCRKFSHDVQHIVADFADANQKIQKHCSQISDLLLCHIEQKKIYDLVEFEESQNSHHILVQKSLATIHESIRNTL